MGKLTIVKWEAKLKLKNMSVRVHRFCKLTSAENIRKSMLSDDIRNVLLENGECDSKFAHTDPKHYVQETDFKNERFLHI
jgi:hypothetical protein